MSTKQLPPPSAAKPKAAPAARMTADSIVRGRTHEPDRILVYGVEGIGKSCLGARAPEPVFIAAEAGVHHLDVPRFPQPESFDDVLACLRTLYAEDLGYRTLVVDTIDFIDDLIHAQAREESGMSPEKWVAYGAGVKVAKPYHERFLAALESLRRHRAMEIILIAHAQTKNFNNPAGADYTRYTVNVAGDATATTYSRWVDTVLFYNYEDVVKKGEGIERSKGVTTGRRLLHTARLPAWDAKCRWNVPEEIEVSGPDAYAPYAEARRAGGVFIERGE